jgi:opacity protein-like surface antigen
MRGVTIGCVLLTTAMLVSVPDEARADGYVTPWIAISAVSANDEGRGGFGVTTGYMGAGIFGFEADVGYMSDFFGLSQFGDGYGITAMGNAILGIPIGGDHGVGVRPFVSGGLGLLRTHIDAGPLNDLTRSNNEFAYNLGAGMMGFFSQHVGLRGEVRYMRALQDTNRGSGIDFEAGPLRFWRASAGVTFR